MRILITGSSGFVGTSLHNYFNKNDQIEVTALDLRKPVALEMISDAAAIIHLAGKAHDLKKTSKDEEYFTVNTTLTKTLFDLFLKSNINDFIYFSSVKAVADAVSGVLTEEPVPNPKTPYGRSKQQAEAYLLSQELPKGKRLIIIRPCMIHGPGNKGNLNLLHKVVKIGLPYPLAAFKNLRSFLAIDNLNYVIERLITDQSIPGGIYNVADDDPLSTNEVIRIMSQLEGHKAKLWKISPQLIKMIAAVGDKLWLPLNAERLRKLTESYIVSNEKLKMALNIKQLPIKATVGLEKTIQSFSSH
ncbi:MAG: NAD-dependent epimerase/dehydratase family protein [Bacteroidota bacterium]